MDVDLGRELTLVQAKPIELYHWELVFPSRIVNQLNELERSKGERINPQNPPPQYGPPQQIRLIPVDSTLRIETVVNIPYGATPVCFRICGILSTDEKGVLAFGIGYKIGDIRVVNIVEAATGDVIAYKDFDQLLRR